MKKIAILLCIFIQFFINAEIIKHKAFILDYNKKYKIANWVTYVIYKNQLKVHDVKRRNNFKKDPLLKDDVYVVDEDYKNVGYDRGHLVPADLFDFNQDLMDETFYMTNITPQVKYFNRGIWKRLELYTRYLAVMYKKIYVVTGCVVFANPKTISKKQIAVPHMFYKVIFDKHKTFLMAFLIPNRSISARQPIGDFVVSLNYIKAITGIKSFKNIINMNKK